MYSEVVEEKRHVYGLELFSHMTQACGRTLRTLTRCSRLWTNL